MVWVKSSITLLHTTELLKLQGWLGRVECLESLVEQYMNLVCSDHRASSGPNHINRVVDLICHPRIGSVPKMV